MSDKHYINSEQFISNIEKHYPNKRELIEELDEVMYSLFYVDTDSIAPEKVRNSAYLIKTLKESIVRNDT